MKTYTKNIFRTVTGNKRRYIVCLLVIILGISVFMGLLCAAPAMRKTADNYFTRQNVYDVKILSKSQMGGFTDGDVEALGNLDGVTGVYGGYTAPVYAGFEGGKYLMQLLSLGGSGINKLEIIDGVLPENENECAVNARFAEIYKLKKGDSIDFSSTVSAINIAMILKRPQMTVTAIVNSPIHTSYLISEFAFLPYEAFRAPALTRIPYNEIYITLDKGNIKSYFSSGYTELLDGSVQKIDALLTQRSVSGAQIEGLNDNSGWRSMRSNSDSIAAVSRVFPIVFLLVAVLVSFTVMLRYTESERMSAGTLKSLGYSNFDVFRKYLFYALAAAVPGGIIGIAFGFWFFPSVIFNYGYSLVFIFESVDLVFEPLYAVLSLITAVLSMLIPTILAGIKDSAAMPVVLTRPKAPPAGKRIFLERIPFIWNRFSFSLKVSLRNLLRNKQRSLLFVIGMAGCTALLLCGFGLDKSIKPIVDRQFDGITVYDYEIALAKGDTAETLGALTAYLDNGDVTREWLACGRVEAVCGEFEVNVVSPSDTEKFSSYIKLKDPKTKEEFSLAADSVIVTQKLAGELGIKAGDGVTFTSVDGETATLTVTGIAENYVMHFIFLSPDVYSQLSFGEGNNCIYGLLNDGVSQEDKNSFATGVIAGGAGSIMFVNNIADFYKDVLTSIQLIVLVIIITAAALAFITLFCLLSINIDERQRELATLKVLGFYRSESSMYIFRENLILSVVSIALGLVLGLFLHSYIVLTAEIAEVMFIRTVGFMSYLYSAVLAFAFMFLTGLIMNRSINRIDMVEALKGVE